MDATSEELVAAWREAVARPAVAAELDALFVMVGDQIEARGPACWASGRCCNFEAFGHRLFVTGLEVAWVTARTPVTLEEVEAAQARGGCPYQRSNLCGIHERKPLACRVFFCDRAAEAWQQELMERLMRELKSMHDRHGVPYRYLEWRAGLRMFG